MNKKEFVKRAAKVLKMEKGRKKEWLYLSFADDKDFLGAVVIQAHGLVDASIQCHRLGINPGGQMAAFDIPEKDLPPEECRNTLLTREQVVMIWPDAKSIGELEAE